MLGTCSKFLVRAAPVSLIHSNGIRTTGSNRQSTYCSTANFASSAAPSPAVPTASVGTTVDTTATPKTPSHKIDITCCGFPKNLIGSPSVVLESNVFGEDACFVASFKSTHVAGVADGVGGWKKYGIDPSKFSSNLMRHCSEVVRQGSFEPSRPDLIIAKAFNNMRVSPRPIGSSTACVLVVHQKTLYSANLGDSGFMVCRTGKIVHKSKEQTHYFNAPFQLTLLPEHFEFEEIIMDTPEKADVHEIELQSGDIVLLATDGLWDNVPETTIVEALRGVDATTLQAACNSLALIARRLSHDEEIASPFAVKAEKHGISAPGGKPDDITLVLLYVS